MNRVIYLLFFLPVLAISQNSYETAEAHFKQEKYETARPIFEKHLEKHPNSLKTREYLGDIAGYSKRWDDAMEYYETLVDANDKSANYHFKYGAVLGMKALSVNKLLGATYISRIKHHFEKSAKLDPNHIDVRWALVEFYIQLPGIIGGSEKKAINFANELARISAVDGYLAKGYIAEYSDRPKDAEKHYKLAIEVGGSPHTYEKLANLYEETNRPEEAIKTATKSLQIHKRNQLNYQIGKIAAQYNLNNEFGIRCLEAYIEMHTAKDGVPKDWAYYRLAQIYKNLGDKKTALNWINMALGSRPDFKQALKEKERILLL